MQDSANGKLCWINFANLINLVYENPIYAVNYGAKGDTGIILISQSYTTKSNNTLWFQLIMRQNGNNIELAVYYSMNGGSFHGYTIGQFSRPSDVDLS